MWFVEFGPCPIYAHKSSILPPATEIIMIITDAEIIITTGAEIIIITGV